MTIPTDLQDVPNASMLQQLDATVKWRGAVLVLRGRYPRHGRVHANLPLIAREGPEDYPLLNRFGDAIIALLDPLEGDGGRHLSGAQVQQGLGVFLDVGQRGRCLVRPGLGRINDLPSFRHH